MSSSLPQRLIVRARSDDRALAAFVQAIAQDAEISIVDEIGPPGRPHTLVISAAPAKAAALEDRYRQSKDLMLERDRPLSLF